MPTIDITLPKGEILAADDLNLPNNAASFALGVRLDKGRLEPYRDMTDVAAALPPGHVRDVFLYENQHWFAWGVFVNAVKSPLAQDQYRRVYFTDDTGPRVTSNLIATGSAPFPDASYELGVPAPSANITGVVNDSGSDPAETSDDETRFYVMTHVTGYGEEGPPGPTSPPIEIKHPNDTVTLTLPVISQNQANITKKRIYRTATGSTTEFLFVAEVPLADTTFLDNVSGDDLGKVLDTADYVAPPDGAKGMVLTADGSAAVFKENEVAISEPYLPYAYPEAYRQSTEYDIVAIAATRTGLVIATEGKPYILSGGHPSSMTLEKLDRNQACVSARSMVDMGDFVLYASPDGLVAVTEGDARLLTKGIVTKRDWQEFKPATIHAYRFEEQYIAFYGDDNDNGNGTAGFIFDPESGSFTRIDAYATAGYTDPLTDALYLVIDGQIKQWDSGSSLDQFTWRSKVFEMPDVAFDSMRVSSPDSRKVGLKLWVDGRQILNVPVLPAEIFKLPSVKGRKWQFELSGTGQVTRMTLATSMSEL